MAAGGIRVKVEATEVAMSLITPSDLDRTYYSRPTRFL